MKSPLILSLFAIVLGAVALTSTFIERTSGAAHAHSAPVLINSEDSIGPRIEALVQENQVLRDRLSVLEMQPVAVDAPRVSLADDSVTREEFDTFRGEMLAALADRGAADLMKAKSSKDLQESVALALTELREGEAAGKARAKNEFRQDRLDEMMPKMEGWLELTPQQSDQMRSALTTRYQREAELLRRWEAGEDPAALGELKRSDRESHQTELSGFLTPTQLETYQEGQGKSDN